MAAKRQTAKQKKAQKTRRTKCLRKCERDRAIERANESRPLPAFLKPVPCTTLCREAARRNAGRTRRSVRSKKGKK